MIFFERELSSREWKAFYPGRARLLESGLSGTELSETHLRLDLSKDLQQQAEAPLFKDLISRIEGEIKAIRFEHVVESVNIALSSSDANVNLERLTLAEAPTTRVLQANTFFRPT